MPFYFKTAPLPKPVFELLQQIAKTEGMSQRAVLVAAITGLVRLRQLHPEHAADVIAEAKKLAPTRSHAVPSPTD